MLVVKRRVVGVSLGLLCVAGGLGCGKGDDASAGASEVSSTGTTAGTGSSGGSGSGGSGDAPTGDVLTTTADPSGAPTTTAEPVACDGPESCTAMEEGDLSGETAPFFRGSFCVSDEVKPGDTLAISATACVHPCLEIDAFSFKWANRCEGEGCEVALALYYTGIVGAACPSDVFGEFDPAGCVFTGPHAIAITPPAKEGPGALLLPFLTNVDAAAIAGGETGAALWARVDAHTQAPERRVAIDYAAANEAAPASCGEGVNGCKCSSVGL